MPIYDAFYWKNKVSVPLQSLLVQLSWRVASPLGQPIFRQFNLCHAPCHILKAMALAPPIKDVRDHFTEQTRPVPLCIFLQLQGVPNKQPLVPLLVVLIGHPVCSTINNPCCIFHHVSSTRYLPSSRFTISPIPSTHPGPDRRPGDGMAVLIPLTQEIWTFII